jgi:hypothetical protein
MSQPLNSELWNKWWILGWILIGLGFLFYEFWSGWGTGKHTPMLTQVVVRYVPWPLTFIVINWLNLHFLLRYLNPKYITR